MSDDIFKDIDELIETLDSISFEVGETYTELEMLFNRMEENYARSLKAMEKVEEYTEDDFIDFYTKYVNTFFDIKAIMNSVNNICSDIIEIYKNIILLINNKQTRQSVLRKFKTTDSLIIVVLLNKNINAARDIMKFTSRMNRSSFLDKVSEQEYIKMLKSILDKYKVIYNTVIVLLNRTK